MSFPVSECDTSSYDIIIKNGTEDDIFVFDDINKFKEAINSSIINSNISNTTNNNNSVNSDSFITLNDLTILTLYKKKKALGYITFKKDTKDDTILTIEYIKSYEKGIGKKLLYLVTCIARDLEYDYIAFEALPDVNAKGINNTKNRNKAKKLFKYYNNLGFTRKGNAVYENGKNKNGKILYLSSQKYLTKISNGTRKRVRN
jgi:hypothetical protein